MNLKYYCTNFKKKSIQFLFNGFKKAFKTMSVKDLKILKISSKKKQSPKAMIISCCDSRVNVEKIFSAKHGELFIHKNIANLVPAYKNKNLNCSTAAALEYGTLVLEVPALIILGHSKCGGIRAYSENQLGLDNNKPSLPFVNKWLKILKPCFSKNLVLKDVKATVKYLEKAALTESLKNLRTYPFIKEREENKKLIILALLYDIENGELFLLNEENKVFSKINGKLS